MKPAYVLLGAVVAFFPPAVDAAQSTGVTVGSLLSTFSGLQVQRGTPPKIINDVVPLHTQSVQEGDVVIASQEAKFTLIANTGRCDEVSITPSQPYTVRGAGQPSTVWGNVYNKLVQWLAPQPGMRVVGVISVRGGPIGMPMASSRGNRIAAKGNSLPIAWVGGGESVTATLFHDGTQLVTLTGLRGGTAVLTLSSGGNLPVGSYRLVLEDGSDPFEIRFSAYDPARLPHVEQTDSADPAFRNLAETLSLATMDDGVWRMEAYRRLIANPSQAAQAMAKALAIGGTPSP